MRVALILSAMAATALSGCAASDTPRPAPPAQVPAVAVRHIAASAEAMNAIATDYLSLSLEIGTHEAGYIDAYYGPAALRTAAEASPRDKPALLAATRALMARLDTAARAIARGRNAVADDAGHALCLLRRGGAALRGSPRAEAACQL